MKTNLDKFFKTDKEVEKTGVWFNLSDETGFLVKPFKASNPAVKSAMAVHYKPYARQVQLDAVDDAKAREIMTKVFVQACLVDWRGVEIDGVVTPFSKEKAVEFLFELPELFNTLMEHASDYRNYKEEFTEGREEVGNS